MKAKMIAAVVLVSLWGCSGGVPGVTEHAFTIKVEGSGKFSGSIMTVSAGKSNSRSVEGTAPASFDEKGTIASTCLQKKDPGTDKFRVILYRDGAVAGDQSTTAEFGAVTVASQ